MLHAYINHTTQLFSEDPSCFWSPCSGSSSKKPRTWLARWEGTWASSSRWSPSSSARRWRRRSSLLLWISTGGSPPWPPGTTMILHRPSPTRSVIYRCCFLRFLLNNLKFWTWDENIFSAVSLSNAELYFYIIKKGFLYPFFSFQFSCSYCLARCFKILIDNGRAINWDCFISLQIVGSCNYA